VLFHGVPDYDDANNQLESLAAAIFPKGSEGHLMAQLSAYTAYFDASGHPSDQPFVVVSGYVANMHQWKYFNTMWEAVHKEFDVDLPFHATDFYARSKQYGNLPPGNDAGKPHDFITTLATVQQLYTLMHVSCVVDMGVYRDIADVFMIHTMVPAFALGARVCVALIAEWQRSFGIEYPIECVFEDGDFGKGKFIDLMRVERMPAPIFKDKDEFPGLQAADHVAWESASHLKRERAAGSPVKRTHPFTQQLAIPHYHVQATLANLLEVCERKGIPIKRSKIIIP
jgi:hypothetical protein